MQCQVVEKVKSENLVALQCQVVEAEEESARSKLAVNNKSARSEALGGTRCSHVPKNIFIDHQN